MMSLGEIYFVYRGWLRAKSVLVQELLAVIGLSIGVALLFASQVASTSLDSSVRALTSQIVGATQLQLDSRAPSGFSERLIAHVKRMPGVTGVLPLLEQPATVVGPHGEASVDLLGADPGFIRAGRLPHKIGAKALAHQEVLGLPSSVARAIGVGSLETVTLHLGGMVKQSVVGAVLGDADIGGLADSQLVIAPIAYAQKLTGMRGRVTRVFVEMRHAQQAKATAVLQRLATRENLGLHPADFDAELFDIASAPAQQGEGLLSAISAFVGFLFAFNAMLLTVPERRRLINAMRRRGTTRAMTVQCLCCEAAAVGTLAGLLGLGLGELLSIEVFRSEPGYLSFAFPIGTQRIVTVGAIALSVGAGIASAFIGVLAPLRVILARPWRSSAAVAHTPRVWRPFLLVTGVLSLAITTFILAARPQAAVAGNFTLIVALMCLLPFLFQAIVKVFDLVQRPLWAASTRQALTALREPTTRVRSLAVAATGAIAVFGTVSITGAQRNLEHGLDRTATEVNDATDLWVSPSGVNNTLATTPFSGAVAAKLQGLPDVASVGIYRGGFLDLGNRRAWVIAPPRDSRQLIPPGQLTDGDVAQASRLLQGHGWAVLSEALAHGMHLHIGQTFMLPSPQPTRFRVAALSTNGGWPPGAIVINASDYASAWRTTAASALMIALRPGVSAAEAQQQVRAAIGRNSGLAVQTAAGRARQWQTISHQGLARLSQIATLVMIAAVLAMAGVMTSMIWQRRASIAYVKRRGFPRGILWRALFFESAILLGAGCSIGAAFGIFGQLVISHALATITGFPITITAGTAVAFASFAIVSAAALAIVAVPGYFVASVRPTTLRPTT
jgi:putative ABC transport system permease protein